MTNKPALAADVLLLGALYAPEQCGLLLTDAALLIEQRRYPTGAAIALLAREELGRHQILLGYWRRSANGTPVTRKQVSKAIKNHIKKQRHSQVSLTNRFQQEDQVAEILKARSDSPPGSAERRAADEKLQLLDDRKKERQPADRHGLRMEAVYVDLADDNSWSRPCALDPPRCADEVVDAINDYIGATLRIEEAATVHEDGQLARAVAGLAARPMFPPRPNISLDASLPPSKKTS